MHEPIDDVWDVDKVNMTLDELFTLWFEKKAVKLGLSNRQSMKSAYKHCKSLATLKYTSIKAYHMQETIDLCGYGFSTQVAIKALRGI